MAGHESEFDITDSSWVVGKDGITFHERESSEESWSEEMTEGEALTRFIHSLWGPSLEELHEGVARDLDKGVY